MQPLVLTADTRNWYQWPGVASWTIAELVVVCGHNDVYYGNVSDTNNGSTTAKYNIANFCCATILGKPELNGTIGTSKQKHLAMKKKNLFGIPSRRHMDECAGFLRRRNDMI